MQLSVRDLLPSRPLVTVTPETTVEVLNRILAEHRISGAPVVDGDGRAIGVVSQSDVVRLAAAARGVSQDAVLGERKSNGEIALARELRGRTVADIMEPRVHSVAVEESLPVVARIMRNLHIHRVVVVEHGKLVGILSAFDLLRVIERPADYAEFYSRAAT